MRDKIKEALEYDPLNEAEKIFDNKHWSEFSDDETSMSMGLCFIHNKNKDILLKEHNDTHFSMNWKEFIDIITSNGFKCGYEYTFSYEDKMEKAALYYRRDGLIIWVTSFWNGKSVNGGKLYGEIKMDNVSDRHKIPSCSNGFYDYENGKLYFDTDIREGLIWFINEMSKYGKFLEQWEDSNRFLWFVDFAEDKEPNYDHKSITREKISRCDEDAKLIMQNINIVNRKQVLKEEEKCIA